MVGSACDLIATLL